MTGWVGTVLRFLSGMVPMPVTVGYAGAPADGARAVVLWTVGLGAPGGGLRAGPGPDPGCSRPAARWRLRPQSVL